MVAKKPTSYTLDDDTRAKLDELATENGTSKSAVLRKLVGSASPFLPQRVIFVGNVSGEQGAYGDVWKGEFSGIVRIHLLNQTKGTINPLMVDVELQEATLAEIIKKFTC